MSDERKIRVTRQRWDRLMLAMTLLVAIPAITTSIATGYLSYMLQAFLPIALWIKLRCSTPPDGQEVHSIEGNPYTILLLGWLSFCLAAFLLLFALDYLILEHKLRDPARLYHWCVFVACFAIMLTGVHIIERRRKASKNAK